MPTSTKFPVRRRGKYANEPIYMGGKRFASKLEARRYGELLWLQSRGEVSELRCQVRYRLVVNGMLIGTYVADFVYREGGAEIVEDTKGVLTTVYELKRKLMLAVHGITIREVYATRRAR